MDGLTDFGNDAMCSFLDLMEPKFTHMEINKEESVIVFGEERGYWVILSDYIC